MFLFNNRLYVFLYRTHVNIENAIDKNGKSVILPGIDFVKVVAGGYHIKASIIGLTLRDIYDCHLTK